MTEKAKILFVDDERQILVSLRALFRSDYKVFVANGGAEALAIVRAEQLDAVISDQRMPNMLGHELLREVKRISPSTMRLLLTGYSDLSAIMSSINDGEIFRFIHKPWNNVELRGIVETAVRIARSTRASMEDFDDFGPIDPEPDFDPIELPPPRPINGTAVTSGPAPAKLENPAGPSMRAPTSTPAQTPTASPKPAASPAVGKRSRGRLPQPVFAPGAALLVLDSDDDTFERLELMYQHERPVLMAQSIDASLDQLDRNEVAIIVSDVVVGGEDATDFIKLLKQEYPLVMTVVLSEAVDSDIAIDLINQGQIYRYLRKPVGDATLKLSINHGLRFYQSNRARPELLQRQQVEKVEELRNRSLGKRFLGRLRSIGRRFSFAR